MKTLLCIHSYPDARDRVWKFWPYYKVPGWPILGIHCKNAGHDWPESTPAIGCGLNSYLNGTDNLAVKLVETIEYVLMRPEYGDVTDICIIEHDALFIRKPPFHPGGLLATRAFIPPPSWGFKCKVGYHTPWWLDKASAVKVLQVGRPMIGEKLRDCTTPDAFIGLCVDRAGIPVHLDKTWSVNSGNLEYRREGCLKAIQDGAWYLHGIKSDADYNFVLEALKKTPGTFHV